MALDPTADRAPEDLTARARIRDAALVLFAERGIDGASIRDIATAAGVSSGLVRHHFGSKEALRDACDSYAMDRMNRLRDQMFDGDRLGEQVFSASVSPAVRLLRDYLVRSMLDGSEAAGAMFDHSVQIAEEFLSSNKIRSTDLRSHAAVLVAMEMGVFLMRDQVSRALGVDIDTPEGTIALNHGFIDVFSQPMLTADQADQIHAALERARAHQSDGGPRDAAGTEE